MIRQYAPRPGSAGLSSDRTAQRAHCGFALTRIPERQAVFIVHRPGMRLRTGQRFKCRQGGRDVAEPTLRHTHDQCGNRMVGNGIEYLGGLLER